MNTMTEIIAAHRYDDVGVICACGVECGLACDNLTHAAHVADELTKAGYGNVQEAKAEALTDAAKELTALPYAKPEAPERAHYERMLAIRRGNTDTWLKERAERIKEEA